jgi:hypothetical protein
MKPIAALSEDEFTHLVRLAVTLPDAPPELVQAAIGVWATRPQAALPPSPLQTAVQSLVQQTQAAVRQLKAVLTFDSWAMPATAMGMRSASAETRHLLFSAMGRDIDLRVAQDAQRFALAGQILGPDETGVVELAPEHATDTLPAQVVRLDAMGEFRMGGVDQGHYVLTLRLGDDVIVLPPIAVGVRAA